MSILDKVDRRNSIPKNQQSRLKIFIGNIYDRDLVNKACQDIDVVFHCASLIDTSKFGSDKQHYLTNVEGTRIIIECCKNNNVESLIFTSSHNVIFTGKEIIMAEETKDYPKPEEFRDYYSKTKAEAEKLVLKANGSKLKSGKELLTIALRPGSIWGPGDLHFSKLIQISKYGISMQPMNDPDFNFTFIKDLAMMHILSSEKLREENITKKYLMSGKSYFTGENMKCFQHYNQILDNIMPKRIIIPLPNFIWLFFGYFLEILAFILSPIYNLKVNL